MTHDVITKRVVVLDDLRKGLTTVTYLKTSLVSLAKDYTPIRKLLFPDADGNIDFSELMQLIEFDHTDDAAKTLAKENMNRYLDLLYKRGKLSEVLVFLWGRTNVI